MSNPIDKKDPEYLRQRQAAYQREYRRREAEKREKAKIDQQIVATVPELQNKILLLEGEIKTKDEVLSRQEANLQQYATIVQELQNQVLLMGNEIKTKDETLSRQSNDLRTKDETISRQEAMLQQQSGDLRIKDETISRQEAMLQQQSGDLRIKDEQYAKLAPYANVGKVYSPFLYWLGTKYPHIRADLNNYYTAYLQQLQ